MCNAGCVMYMRYGLQTLLDVYVLWQCVPVEFWDYFSKDKAQELSTQSVYLYK